MANENVGVKFTLSLSRANLVVESLQERYKLMEKHGKLKGDNTEERALIRDSRTKALELDEIIKIIEG